MAAPAFPGSLNAAEAKRLEAGLRRGLATDPARRPTAAGELVELLRAGWDAEAPSGVLTILAATSPIADVMWHQEPHRAAAAVVHLDESLASAAAAHRGRVVESGLAAFHRPADAVAAAASLGAEHDDHRGDRHRAGAAAGRAVRRLTGGAGSPDQGPGTPRRGTGIRHNRRTAARPPRLVDLGPHQEVGTARVFALDAPGLAVPPTPVCPWPGLPAYGVDRTDLFVGREDVAADLRARLAPSAFVAVVGASGVGKSSLLRAGVAAHVPGARRGHACLGRCRRAGGAGCRPAGRRGPVGGGVHDARG